MADHENSFLLLSILTLASVVIIFGMKYFISARSGGSNPSAEEAYRLLAEKSAAAQSASVMAIASLKSEIAETRTKLTSIERLLKEVE